MSNSTLVDAPTRHVVADGTALAYKANVPLRFLQHFRGPLDCWNPHVTERLAKNNGDAAGLSAQRSGATRRRHSGNGYRELREAGWFKCRTYSTGKRVAAQLRVLVDASTMVGALAIARVVDDPGLSASIF
jgi:hypothetical protein